jgi:hypothetical protein
MLLAFCLLALHSAGVLAKYSRDLTSLAAEGKLVHIYIELGRQQSTVFLLVCTLQGRPPGTCR